MPFNTVLDEPSSTDVSRETIPLQIRQSSTLRHYPRKVRPSPAFPKKTHLLELCRMPNVSRETSSNSSGFKVLMVSRETSSNSSGFKVLMVSRETSKERKFIRRANPTRIFLGRWQGLRQDLEGGSVTNTTLRLQPEFGKNFNVPSFIFSVLGRFRDYKDSPDLQEPSRTLCGHGWWTKRSGGYQIKCT